MSKRMLIDATHAEETRVVIMDGNRLEDYDVEAVSRKKLKGNIYLARVVRIEPSLQAAFVEYGGNRHGFLPLNEIHPDYFQIPIADREKLLALQEEQADKASIDNEYFDQSLSSLDSSLENPSKDTPPDNIDIVSKKDLCDEGSFYAQPQPDCVGGEADTGEETLVQKRIAHLLRHYRIQEVIRRRQIILVQVVKEERGNKGAALTTYISLAGRYCVLMPNTLRHSGISRKITSTSDRCRLKDIITNLRLPRGMAMIIRTAGAQQPEPEIVRDYDYLIHLWNDIREFTIKSIAPAFIYEEASLVRRAIRDMYTHDIKEIIVDGENGWKAAYDFMRVLVPQYVDKVRLWQKDNQSLFAHFHIEGHLNAMFSPIVALRSGGYLVINQTEALVAIDVNSGKATSQRSIEETAFTTNQEAAEEVARQLRLRDLAGLIVIDFIDMESRKHNIIIEQRLKDALRHDRARIQIGSISHFGLLEMSRQRLRPSVAETAFSTCSHCNGTGVIRSIENAALHVLRTIEEESARRRSPAIMVYVAPEIALYILNHKRQWLNHIEQRYRIEIHFSADSTLTSADVRIKRHAVEKIATHHENTFTDTVDPMDLSSEKSHEEISMQISPQNNTSTSHERDFLLSPQEDIQETSSARRNLFPNRRRTRYARVRRRPRRQQAYRDHEETFISSTPDHSERHSQENSEEDTSRFSPHTYDLPESNHLESIHKFSTDYTDTVVDDILSYHHDSCFSPHSDETSSSQPTQAESQDNEPSRFVKKAEDHFHNDLSISSSPPIESSSHVTSSEESRVSTIKEADVILSEMPENPENNIPENIPDETSKPIQPVVIKERQPTEQRRTGWWRR
ncbi:MAG: ribonuclease E/G [Acetobacter sp.]|nr:ribonuclease E/G [Acetobacter sp.]